MTRTERLHLRALLERLERLVDRVNQIAVRDRVRFDLRESWALLWAIERCAGDDMTEGMNNRLLLAAEALNRVQMASQENAHVDR